MPLICKKCCNKENFTQDVTGNRRYDGSIYLDNNGEETDRDTDDDWDSDSDETYGPITCNECGSKDVVTVSEAEWEEWNGPSKAVKKQKSESWRTCLRRRGITE